MKRKEILRKTTAIVITTGLMLSSISTFAMQLPDSIDMDGKTFVMDKSAGGGSGTAIPDEGMNMKRSSYKVTGSDVRLYVDYSHGHGGDHFAGGWVEATAPRFTARAEVWSNGRLDTTGSNNLNKGKIASASSYLAMGIVKNVTPHIFYNW